MSVRFSHSLSGRSNQKKVTRKKPKERQAWDSSVQDLNVHRATPEELAHRHEIHKSRNRYLAQREIQKTSLRRKWRKQNGGSADPMEERRLELMMEILCDQYQMKDVLERSDRAMAVVKDLFGDAPRRHTGCPHVTMAPSCDPETSRGPLAQRRDPPTRLSVLSESVMDSQALNEVEESESEESEEDVGVSITFQPRLQTDRVHQIFEEDRSHPASPHWSSGNAGDAHNPFVTPKSSAPPSNGQTALNATAAVRKVKSRLAEEEEGVAEQGGAEDPKCVIGRILNPNPPNYQQVPAKGKKKKRSPSRIRTPGPPACELSGQSGLDLLNHMMQEVEEELEDYERQTGREAGAVPKPQGLTGFTTALVSAIRRLVTYLKEGDRRLCEEMVQRQRLEAELGEQRMLIDALTAEILSMKENSSVSPSQLSHVSDRSLSPPEVTLDVPHAVQSERRQSSAISSSAIMGLPEVKEEAIPPAPPSDRHVEHSTDVGGLLGFQPAILLSPPRQRTREAYEGQFSSLRSSIGMMTDPRESKAVPETPSSFPSFSPAAMERGSGLPRDQGRKGQNPAPLSSHPSSSNDESPPSVREDASGCNDSIAARMAELALQNNALKAQLKEIGRNAAINSDLMKTGDHSTAAKSCADTTGASVMLTPVTPMTPMTPMTLEQRIAALNRQSAEARNKLLTLIEQQKQSAVISPAISPITPQSQDSVFSGRRDHTEAAIPMPHFTDSSMEVTPSPDRRSSGRRSNTSHRSGSSVISVYKEGRGAGEAAWAKVGRQKEEGWFALTAHVS